MGEAYGGTPPEERFAGAAIVPESGPHGEAGRARRIVPIAGRGLLRWYDPGELKRHPLLEQPGTDATTTRRLHQVARAYVLASTAALLAVLLLFSGRPPVVTLALAFCCVLVAAYLAVSSVRSVPWLRRQRRPRLEAKIVPAPRVSGAESSDAERLASSA